MVFFVEFLGMSLGIFAGFMALAAWIRARESGTQEHALRDSMLLRQRARILMGFSVICFWLPLAFNTALVMLSSAEPSLLARIPILIIQAAGCAGFLRHLWSENSSRFPE